MTATPVRGRRIRLNTASSMVAVDAVQSVAEAYAVGEGLNPDEAHFLAVGLREALVNAIKHGHRERYDLRIRVDLQTDSHRTLVFTVRDDGDGFDPSRVPDPLAPENVSRGSGRGIFYMTKFADEVLFTFPKKGGTVVRLQKRMT